MRFYFSFFIIFLVLLAIDIYSLKAIRTIVRGKTTKLILSITYILISLIIYVLVGSVFFQKPNFETFDRYATIANIFAALLIFWAPKVVILIFHFLDDIQLLVWKLMNGTGLSNSKTDSINQSRRAFITKAGILIASVPFASVLYGFLKGRFDFTVFSEKITFNNLPSNFNGFKIVQFSDFHFGSLAGNYAEVEEAIDQINQQEPDLLVFTGDLVNNSSREIDEFLPLLKKLNARYGKYSILGNHDYGDYSQWKSDQHKRENFNRIIGLQEEAGFKVLRNENKRIAINNQTIQLIGVENWGHPPFPRYGDLKAATHGVNNKDFSILLSHDPSHWDAEVIHKTNIDLTLAGHTHGMQFGIEISGIKWSPAQLKYPRWAGLYAENNQYLYVNRGIGYIGVAARVGIKPEITVIELVQS